MKVLSFEQFEQIMDGIKQEIRFQNKMYSAFRELDGECYRRTPSIYMLINLLNIIFEDDDECPLIDYFIYNLDFGEMWKDGCITDEGGNSVELKTVSDLYDALMKQKVEKGAKQ